MKKFLFALFFSISSLFASATLFHGSTQNISINSQPDGANVYVDGQLMGTTPVTLSLKKGKYKTIEIRKKCYKAVTLPLQKTFDPVAILNIFWDLSTTDFITGNLWEYSPNHYFIKLQKEPNCQLARWRAKYHYLNLKTKDNLISFVLIFFNDIKNHKRLNSLQELIKESKCKISIKKFVEAKNTSQALRLILNKCK